MQPLYRIEWQAEGISYFVFLSCLGIIGINVCFSSSCLVHRVNKLLKDSKQWMNFTFGFFLPYFNLQGSRIWNERMKGKGGKNSPFQFLIDCFETWNDYKFPNWMRTRTNEWPHRMVNCMIFPAFSFAKMTHFHQRNIAVSCSGSGGDDDRNSILYHNWKSHLRGRTENRKQSKKQKKKRIEKNPRKT